MKFTLVCLGLAVCVDAYGDDWVDDIRVDKTLQASRAALVRGETCSQTSDCSHLSCTGDGWVLACSRGECTCNNGGQGGSCTRDSDCPDLNCNRFTHERCIRGECHCGFGGGIGK